MLVVFLEAPEQLLAERRRLGNGHFGCPKGQGAVPEQLLAERRRLGL